MSLDDNQGDIKTRTSSLGLFQKLLDLLTWANKNSILSNFSARINVFYDIVLLTYLEITAFGCSDTFLIP